MARLTASDWVANGLASREQLLVMAHLFSPNTTQLPRLASYHNAVSELRAGAGWKYTTTPSTEHDSICVLC